MKSYRTIIVEDEGPARRRLEKMVKSHSFLTLVASLKNGFEAVSEIPKYNPDLLLLDIQLKDKTAFQVLEELDQDIFFKIIFITAFDSYALKAFEVEALDYLQKPYDEIRFRAAIDRVIKNDKNVLNSEVIKLLEKGFENKPSTLVIPEGNKEHFFQINEITHIESDKYYVEVNTMTGKSIIRITLKNLGSILPQNFIRINKSVIVNTNHISQVDHKKQSSKIHLKTKEVFFSSKSYNHNLKNFLSKNIY